MLAVDRVGGIAMSETEPGGVPPQQDRSRVEELLRHWADQRRQGQTLSAKELCRDCPELAPEVARQIAAVTATVETPGRDTPGTLDDAATLPGPPIIVQAGRTGPPSIPGYQIVGELGRGGMGVVYKAVQVALKRPVALKMILVGAHAGPLEVARFRAEAEAVARLQHPNIVQVHDIGEDNGLPYFSLEFIDGGNLAQKLAERPLEPRHAAQLVETLARAVHYAHQRGVIHRDLKPANVLLTADGLPKITDFGLAKQVDAAFSNTQTGAMLGTPSYMSPEQAEGKKGAIGPATDVHALGAMLYEMLTGRPPFREDTPLLTAIQVMTATPARPTELRRGVPPELEAICLKCLRKEPEARYATAEALADDLRAFLAGHAISVTAPATDEGSAMPGPAGRPAATETARVGARPPVWRRAWVRRALLAAIPLLLIGLAFKVFFGGQITRPVKRVTAAVPVSPGGPGVAGGARVARKGTVTSVGSRQTARPTLKPTAPPEVPAVADNIVMYRTPVPPTAGLALVAAREVHERYSPARGAVAIVLDITGSMMWDDREKGSTKSYGDELQAAFKLGKSDGDLVRSLKEQVKRNMERGCKYKEALEGIRAVLDDLPDGAIVSFTVFGAYIDEWGIRGQREHSPRQTIKMIREPRPWSRASDYKRLMDRLQGFVPWNETPLVRAMVEARKNGFPKDFKGFKSMLVVTDGADNDFRSDKVLQQEFGTNDLGTCLTRAFERFDVLLNVIGFRVVGAEKAFLDQFENVIEKRPGGRFYTIDKTDELKRKLKKGLQTGLRYRIYHADTGELVNKNMPEDGWEIGGLDGHCRWTTRLAPGRYRIGVQINSRFLRQEVELAAGDYLLVSLSADGDRLHFERVVYGQGHRREGLGGDDRWVLTVFQNQLRLPERSLDMMVTLENVSGKAPKPDSILRQVQPRVTWLELKPPQGNTNFAVRWGNLLGYPAPAWSLHVPRWPPRRGRAEAARPELEAWWMTEAPAAATLEWTRDEGLERAFRGTKDLGSGGNVKIAIDSVGFETRRVQSAPDVQPRDGHCLVIRARYPKGHEIWLEPIGLNLEGQNSLLCQEHHYDEMAGQYTCVFWPLTEDQARNQLEGLKVVLVEEFKRAALHIGMRLEQSPSPDDTRPNPVTDLVPPKIGRR
jgi:hypothetical protein